MDRVMSHESHLGPTCGAVTAQKKKAGVGLLLNGALSTYLGYNMDFERALSWRHRLYLAPLFMYCYGNP